MGVGLGVEVNRGCDGGREPGRGGGLGWSRQAEAREWAWAGLGWAGLGWTPNEHCVVLWTLNPAATPADS